MNVTSTGIQFKWDKDYPLNLISKEDRDKQICLGSINRDWAFLASTSFPVTRPRRTLIISKDGVGQSPTGRGRLRAWPLCPVAISKQKIN